MLVGRGVCVVAVAAWSSSSTGNASKHWELTGTRCLRLPTGGFLLWNKSVSGGSSLPLHCLAIFSVLYLKLFFCSRFLIYQNCSVFLQLWLKRLKERKRWARWPRNWLSEYPTYRGQSRLPKLCVNLKWEGSKRIETRVCINRYLIYSHICIWATVCCSYWVWTVDIAQLYWCSPVHFTRFLYTALPYSSGR